MNNEDAARFWDKVDKGPGCWTWCASLDGDGYGRFMVDGKASKANRVAWMIEYGASPGEFCVLHSCDNPECVNPSHLFLGTQKVNVEDREKKGRGNQPKGERQAKAKLTDSAVREIRELYATGQHTYVRLAEMHCVSKAVIHRVVKRKSWRHVI